MKIGDLVRIQAGFCSVLDVEFDWIGMLLGHYPDTGEGAAVWLVQWAHSPEPAREHGYYLEVI